MCFASLGIPKRYVRSMTFLIPARAPARIAAVLRDSPNAIRQLMLPRYSGSEREWKFSIFLLPRPRPSDTKIGSSSTLQRRATPAAMSSTGSGFGLAGAHPLCDPLDQSAVGENLERRSRLPPARRNDVVLLLFEVRISDFR